MTILDKPPAQTTPPQGIGGGQPTPGVGAGQSSRLKYYEIREQRVVEVDNPQAPIHIYINPGNGERKYLVENFNVDEHTLGSALDPDEQARLEFEPEHVALIFKRPRNYSGKDQLLFKVSSVGLFLFKDRLVVVLPEDIPLFEAKHFQRVTRLPQVMLRLISGSIAHFLEHLRIINLICDEVEKKINTAMENRYLLNLFTLEKSMVYYQNSISSNGVLFERIKNNAAKIGFTSEEIEFLDDMIIENNQCYKQAEIYSNILASMMDARASIVSNNLNVLIKILNVITIALMVPTLIVSIFSMNVKLPLPQEGAFWPFWGIMGFASLSVIAFYLFYQWMKRKF